MFTVKTNIPKKKSMLSSNSENFNLMQCDSSPDLPLDTKMMIMHCCGLLYKEIYESIIKYIYK